MINWLLHFQLLVDFLDQNMWILQTQTIGLQNPHCIVIFSDAAIVKCREAAPPCTSLTSSA